MRSSTTNQSRSRFLAVAASALITATVSTGWRPNAAHAQRAEGEAGEVAPSVQPVQHQTVSVTIPAGHYEIVGVDGGQQIVADDYGYLLVPGKPKLPAKIFAIAIGQEQEARVDRGFPYDAFTDAAVFHLTLVLVAGGGEQIPVLPVDQDPIPKRPQV